MKFFNDCKCIEEVKEIYRKLLFQFHPDINHAPDAEEKTKELNAEYEVMFKRLKNIHKSVKKDSNEPYYEDTKNPTKEVPEDFIGILNILVKLHNIQIELTGRWLWVTGETKPVKDILKDAGCHYSGNKQAWYWRKDEDKSHRHKAVPMDKIRDVYGSQQIETRPENGITIH